jgi:hypothetical protein
VARFLGSEEPIGDTGRVVGDFWAWAFSDLVANTTRSAFAEFLVGHALGVLDRPRVSWDAVDLRYGEHKIEVKAAGLVQTWPSKPHSVARQAGAASL